MEQANDATAAAIDAMLRLIEKRKRPVPKEEKGPAAPIPNTQPTDEDDSEE